jgi:uncharacterized membrane protein
MRINTKQMGNAAITVIFLVCLGYLLLLFFQEGVSARETFIKIIVLSITAFIVFIITNRGQDGS